MNILIIITITIISSLLTAFAVVVFIVKKLNLFTKQEDSNSMQILNQNMQSLSRNVYDAINTTNQAINERLDNASRVIMSVNQELGQMKEIGLNLKNIQDFLKSPKLRGNLGEQGLKELLSQALPAKYYDFQYCFRNGFIVDAIIHLDGGHIPIDSKFPLENFNLMLRATTRDEKESARRAYKSDFKKHVQAIAKKYINPDEGTVDFAFMYIPSESIYFEVINNEQDLFEFAAHNHIVVSSPSTFFYYLRTIMLGLEGRRITEMSREILKTLKAIKQQTANMGDNLSVLNKHITNSGKTMSLVNDQYSKLAEKIQRIDSLESEETELLAETYE